MKIRVTANDIRCGSPNLCYSCPIALAIERALHYRVSVGPYDVWLHGDQNDNVPLPSIAAKFIKDFDAGRSVRPFAFELDLTKKL